MELVTGHGASEHITAAQVSRLIQGVTVMDDTTVYRLNVGNDCAIGVNGLTVGISTGEMVLHGYHTTFEDAETLTLDPTLDAAKSRIDKICLIISEDLTTGIQSAYIQVVQGTEATTPTTPATPSTPTSPTELYMGVGVIATVTVSDTVIASYVDNTDLYAGSFVTKAEFDTNIANIAPIEATSTASKAYSVGSQLIYNGLLYKVDSAIAQGATLTPGGNISLSPTVEAQIASVKSSLNFNKLGTITMVSTDLQSSFCSKLATLLSGKTGLFFTTGPFEFVGEVVNGTYRGNYQRMEETTYTVDYTTNNSYYRASIPNGAAVTVQNLYSVATGTPRSIDVYFKS